MLTQAKKLWLEGYAVHFLLPKSKRPVLSNWTTGPRHSWESLKQNYVKGYNLGVRLGEASSFSDGSFLGVIDCDVKSSLPEHLIEMESKLLSLGISIQGLGVLSGRGNGSRHIYVRTKELLSTAKLAVSDKTVKVPMPSVKPSKRELRSLTLAEIKEGLRLRPAWEISFLGNGAQVVVPPSIHPDSGNQYQWVGTLDDAPQYFAGVKAVEDRKEKSVLNDWEAVPVDLIGSSLSDDTIAKIVSGDGVEDRSAALLGVVIAMRGAGFSENEILSCLTDSKNYLGQVGFDHAKTRSRKRAAEWILNFTMKKAEKVSDVRGDFEVVENPEIEVEVSELVAKENSEVLLKVEDWRTRIERDGKSEKPKPSFFNTKLILENVVDGGQSGFLKHNEFNLEDTWLKETPWGSKRGHNVRDIDILNIKDYLVEKFRVEVSKEKITEVLQVIGDKNSFHPVREYLDSLEWDGVSRLDSWLTTYLGVEGPVDYISTVGRKTLTAMVARIYDPGCAFHHVLILEGQTRRGKSETWKILASKEWHLDNELDLSNKDSRQMLLGKWVVELAELAAIHQSGVNSMKNFISNDIDTFRKPYGRFVETFKRSCIFVGTTNNEHYLKDLTGNARYWPVKIKKLKYHELIRDRDQLLAEAVANYQLGEQINFHSDEFYALAEKEQAEREEGEEVGGLVQSALLGRPDAKGISSDPMPDTFRIAELLKNMDQLPGFKSERALVMKVAKELQKLGFQKRRETFQGIQGWFWSKK